MTVSDIVLRDASFPPAPLAKDGPAEQENHSSQKKRLESGSNSRSGRSSRWNRPRPADESPGAAGAR